MKELSIKEKAKAYDNVRDKIAIRFGSNVAEEIFSEFEESKDERIRKHLIGVVELYYGNTDEQEKKDCLAWLEKQGGHKLDTDFSDLRTWKYIVDAVWTEKEGIGQYLDSPFTEEIAKKLQKRFGNIEQKPTEWSEEDEKTVHLACEFIRHHSRKGDSIGGIDCTELIKMLKSVKNRVQPKQEWSNWDKTIIESIEALCDEKIKSVVYQDVKEHANDIKEWLKSLRPQSTWKPSDMELEVLRLAAEKDGVCLMKLYEQLKKLREE